MKQQELTNRDASIIEAVFGLPASEVVDAINSRHADAGRYETMDQFAARLGVSRRTVFDLIRKGKLSGVIKLKREWRIPVGAETSLVVR